MISTCIGMVVTSFLLMYLSTFLKIDGTEPML